MSEVKVAENALRNYMAEEVVKIESHDFFVNSDRNENFSDRIDKFILCLFELKTKTPEQLIEKYGREIFLEKIHLFHDYTLEGVATYKSGDMFEIIGDIDETKYMVLWTGDSSDDLRGIIDLSSGQLAFNNNDFCSIEGLLSEFVFNYGAIQKLEKEV